MPSGFLGGGGSPFFWGRGGSRMAPEDIALRRRLGAQQMQQGADYSPIASPWQGLARVANGITGGLQMRSANRAEDEARTAQQSVIEGLLAPYDPASGAPDPVAVALADPSLRQLGMSVLQSRTPAPVEPSIQRRNDGSIVGINPTTGEIMFEQADPNPKPVLDWLEVALPGGQKKLIPVGPNGPITGDAAQPPATLPPDFDFGEGGPGGSPSGAGFRP